MNSDDYSRQQSAKDAEYEREYRAWVESMPADERLDLEAQGLAAPCVAHYGNGSASGDAADSPLMREGDDPAVMPEPEPESTRESCDVELVCCTRTAGRLLAGITGHEDDSLDACLRSYLAPDSAPAAANADYRFDHNSGSKVREILGLYLVLRIEIAVNAQAKAQMLEEAWNLENAVLPAMAAIEANGIFIDRRIVDLFAARGNGEASLLLVRINQETCRFHAGIDPHGDAFAASFPKLGTIEKLQQNALHAALSAPAGRSLVVACCSNIGMFPPQPGRSAANAMKGALALVQSRLPEDSLLVLKTDDGIFAECPAAAVEKVRTILVECLREGMCQGFPGVPAQIEAGIWQD